MKDGLQRKRPMELHLAQHLITVLHFKSSNGLVGNNRELLLSVNGIWVSDSQSRSFYYKRKRKNLIFTFKFSVALLRITKNRTCPFAVGGHMLMFISPPKLFCGLGRRLSVATILDGTWKNTYSIPNFRFYCNMKKRTGKHDTLTIPKKKLDLFSIAPKTAMAVEQFHTAIWHSVLGVD
ncbi:hypothetical protein NC653_000375 [Populus alba x Populus x berolinensis]|uniref:Uncharacterized protein n=1 Tax=Populus alba x Populus x berolinensis TaxID=444605 RepID=A0AAD6RHV8_9ROSI|nr:hypothetical protein NC653_000097 [Populus alba x Populus x berolinensis]KAJ7009656.1 hypothetical protein NC653_000375 [Populus alba x Populus x berolinensis]